MKQSKNPQDPMRVKQLSFMRDEDGNVRVTNVRYGPPINEGIPWTSSCFNVDCRYRQKLYDREREGIPLTEEERYFISCVDTREERMKADQDFVEMLISIDFYYHSLELNAAYERDELLQDRLPRFLRDDEENAVLPRRMRQSRRSQRRGAR